MVTQDMTAETKALSSEGPSIAVQENELRELNAIFEEINQTGLETLQRINSIQSNIKDMLKKVRAARADQDRLVEA